MRNVNGTLALKYRTFGMLLITADVLFDDVDTFYNHTFFLGDHLNDFPAFTFFGSSDDDDFIAAFDMKFSGHGI
jgi:hypothetical protein